MNPIEICYFGHHFEVRYRVKSGRKAGAGNKRVFNDRPLVEVNSAHGGAADCEQLLMAGEASKSIPSDALPEIFESER